MRRYKLNEKPSYFSILTADVRYDERLKANEKIMYSEITALSNKYGYCSASNNYFAKLYKVHKDTISDWINNLKKFGYIRVELEYKDGTKQIKNRKLYINHYHKNDGLDPIGEITDTLSGKSPRPYRQNHRDPIGEITVGNNTRLNITRCNNNHDEADWKQTIINEWNALDDNIPKLQALNPNTKRYSLIQARINQYGLKKVVDAIKSIDQSDFLKGYKTDFKVTFDWFTKPNNFVKVMEGNYIDKKVNQDISQEKEMSIAEKARMKRLERINRR